MKTQMDMDAYEGAVYDNDALSLSLARTLQEQDDTAAAVEMTGAQTPPQPPVQASSSNVQRSHEHDEAEDRRVAQVQQDLNATAGLQQEQQTPPARVTPSARHFTRAMENLKISNAGIIPESTNPFAALEQEEQTSSPTPTYESAKARMEDLRALAYRSVAPLQNPEPPVLYRAPIDRPALNRDHVANVLPSVEIAIDVMRITPQDTASRSALNRRHSPDIPPNEWSIANDQSPMPTLHDDLPSHDRQRVSPSIDKAPQRKGVLPAVKTLKCWLS